jgi:hypothetical protein
VSKGLTLTKKRHQALQAANASPRVTRTRFA